MKRKKNVSWFFRWAAILAVVLSVLTWVSVSYAEEKDDALIISMDRAYAPLTFVNSFGRPSGLLVDLWRTWAEKTGRKIKFRVSSWSETLEALKNGDADFHSGLSFSKDREKWIGFSTQIYETFTRVYHRVGDPQPAGIGGYGTDGVGVMSGSYQEAKFREAYPDVKIRSLVTTDDLINALMKAEVRAVIQEETIMGAALDRLGLHGDITSRAERLFPSTIHAGVLKDKTDLLQEINKGLSLIQKSKMAEMERRWIHNPEDRYYRPEAKSIKLSGDEEAWLKAHPVIRVHNEMEWAPFNFFENGTPKGFSIGYMNLLASKLGIEIQYITGPTWNEFINMVKNNELDIMLNIARSPERETFLAFTHQPYVNLMQALYTRDDQPFISSIEDLYGKTFAIPKGFYLQEFLEKHPKIKIHEISNTTEAIKAVSVGKADVLFDLMPVVDYITDQLQVTNLKVGGDIGITEGKQIPLYIGMRKELAPLAGILQKAMGAVTDDELRELREKWLGLTKKSGRVVSLTSEEKTWISNLKAPLLVANEMDWPPFDFAENGEAKGFSIHMIMLAADKVGVEIDFVNGFTWKELMEKFKRKELDILPAVYETPERHEFMSFTSSYVTNPSVLVVHDESKEIRTLKDLEGKTVAVIEGFVTANIMETRYPGIKQLKVTNVLEGLKSVSLQKADAFIGSLGVISYELEENVIPDIRITAEIWLKDPKETKLHFGVAKEKALLLDILQKGLDAISPEELQILRRRWLPIEISSQKDTSDLGLSDTERKWITSHPVLTLGIDPAWPPFEFLGQTGRYSGIGSGIVEAIGDRLKIEMKPIPDLTWSQVITKMKAGEIDILPAVVPTKQRKEYMNFTYPIQIPWGL